MGLFDGQGSDFIFFNSFVWLNFIGTRKIIRFPNTTENNTAILLSRANTKYSFFQTFGFLSIININILLALLNNDYKHN